MKAGESTLRLDTYLTENGLAKSRERAKELIKNGFVSVDGRTAKKSSEDVSDENCIEVTGGQLIYVGRGGLKLEAAVKHFGIMLSGMECVDIGASTGGFTDCMLKNGAVKVFAVDVGHDQLDGSLVNDSRVVNMEKTNIRNTDRSVFGDNIGFVSADVSFVSVTHIIPKIAEILDENGSAAVLIKPQFEAGKSNIGKNGIVRDRKVHCAVLKEISAVFCENGFEIVGIIPSPIKGGDGNIEYLAYVKHDDPSVMPTSETIKKIVENAFDSAKEI